MIKDFQNIKRIVYTCVVADLVHSGHIKALKFAKSLGDYLICGVLTDEAVESYRRVAITNFEERKAVIENLKIVDRVIVEHNLDATENLKKIHDEFGDAKLIFVRFGDKWRSFPESEYLKSINGELIRYIQPKYISDYKILQNLLESYKGRFNDLKEFINYFKVKDFVYYDANKIKTAIMSTKADTLRMINPFLKHSSIEKPFVFTVKEWKNNKERILQDIKKEFSPRLIVIRSSAFNEDTAESSMAGYYDTQLNVPSNDLQKIESSVTLVMNSYDDKKSLNDLNQILVQPQTTEINISGVIFTKTLENGAPYYTINYDDSSGYSDTVTKGLEHKTINIFRFSNPKNYPHKFYKLLMAIQEIEQLLQNTPLDIEFAINKKGEVIIFQVRPLVIKSNGDIDDEIIEETIKQLKENFKELSKRKTHLASNDNCFADMPDWNPAEIIGDRPNHLDYSLYDYVITNEVWHQARSSQGYYDVNPAKLVVLFGDKPYVDVRNTFNSFTPSSISKELREKLVNFYINKLKKHPELQDKVEFEILYTCYDLMFDERLKELLENGFNKNEVLELKDALISLTNSLILNYEDSIKRDLNNQEIKFLNEELDNESPKLLVKSALNLLENCKKGTLQFSRLARLAFIGKIMLKSLVKKGKITEIEYNLFLSSINTVATSINLDFNRLLKNEIEKTNFLNKYGHLRPGTYDITSKRYSDNPDLLDTKSQIFSEIIPKKNFIFNKESIGDLNKELKENSLNFDAEYLLDFTKKSIEARELSKFEFTKNLSYAIELIAKTGEILGFNRDEMAKLDMESISKINDYNESEIKQIWQGLIEFRDERKSVYRKLILPPIIFSENDFEVIYHYLPKPNFITQKKINAKVINFNNVNQQSLPDLNGKIILLENGDPGYDWVFTKNIAGLITKYGGVASHMSIRCAEFGLPAAIGCGELFDKIKGSFYISLNCDSGKIIPLNEKEAVVEEL